MAVASVRISRLEDAETVLELVAVAIAVIPINALAAQMTWMPSPQAIEDLRRAKEALDAYSKKHHT